MGSPGGMLTAFEAKAAVAVLHDMERENGSLVGGWPLVDMEAAEDTLPPDVERCFASYLATSEEAMVEDDCLLEVAEAELAGVRLGRTFWGDMGTPC